MRQRNRLRPAEKAAKAAASQSAPSSTVQMHPPEGLRVNKALAMAGLCSRRQADEWVAAGLVTVNGKVLREVGQKLQPDDTVTVRGQKVDVSALFSGKAKHVYLMLNKPVAVVSTAADPEGRKTVLAFIPEALKAMRLYPVGRLDYFSEGLLLLTNDGDLTLRLTHPRHHLPKYYEVLVRETPPESALETMRQGMKLADGQRLAPVEAALGKQDERGVWLHLTLHQGVNRQIRRMCRDLNLTILRLIRTGQGPLRLGELPAGACRHLSEPELAGLRRDLNH